MSPAAPVRQSGRRPSQKSRSLSATAGAAGRLGRKKEEKKNIFADFLREADAEEDARRQGSETWQDDARRRLKAEHRTTRRMLELSEEDLELKDKRYSNDGHKVMMQSMMRDNTCRNDKILMREARRAGAPSPEVYQLKKYNKDLYVKPPTPPPVAKPKPKLGSMIASDLSDLFGRREPVEPPDVF